MIIEDDLGWLLEQLHGLTDDALLPKEITLDVAVDLYLTEQCSIGQAAHLAGVTRWQLQDELSSRGKPASLGSDLPLEELDDMVELIEVSYGSRQ